MSARVKTPGTDVSSLVDELRDQADDEVKTPNEASDATNKADEASLESEGEGGSEQAESDPRLEVKIVDKAPCDRLDDLSQAADEAPDELVRIVEGLIFASPHPLHVREAAQILEDYEPLAVQAAFKILSLGRPGSGLQLSRSAQGYRWTTDPAHAPYVQRLVMAKPQRLSRPQLETLAVIAYRQPVTRPEIDHIRGVDSQATIKALVDRELIAVVGQTADPGRPRLYGTTLFFLEYLNITELQSLPPLGELDQLSERTRELLRSKVGVDEAERLSAQVLALAKAQDEAAARGEDASQVVVELKEESALGNVEEDEGSEASGEAESEQAPEASTLAQAEEGAEASVDEQDEPDQEGEEEALAQAEEGEDAEVEDESEREEFAQTGEGEEAEVSESEEDESGQEGEEEVLAQGEEAEDDSEQEEFAQAEESEDAEVSESEEDESGQEREEEEFAQGEEAEDDSEQEEFAQAEESEDAEVSESEEDESGQEREEEVLAQGEEGTGADKSGDEQDDPDQEEEAGRGLIESPNPSHT